MTTILSAAVVLLAVLPITALEVLDISGKILLLAGRGSSITLIDTDTRDSLCSRQVLPGHAIHGIVSLGHTETRLGRFNLDVIVYGGRQIAWITFDITIHDRNLICSFSSTNSTIIAKDWIISCKKTHGQLSAAFVTSYNALYCVEANTLTRQLRCSLVSDLFGVFLYSADLTQRHEKSYVVASGTVFGQIIVWLCTLDDTHQTWKSKEWVQFNGHRGSIFGVSISNPSLLDGLERRKIVSCSDDRMICVWDLPGLSPESADSDMDASDGFQQHDSALTKMYGHLSRIWNVDFAPITGQDHRESLLLSTGEDGQAQSWLLLGHIASDTHTSHLENRYADRHHAGKNIWARCQSTREGMITFFTGGADGKIACRQYDREGKGNSRSRHGSQAFKHIRSTILEPGSNSKSSFALKTYMTLDSGHILATTDTHHLLKGTVLDNVTKWEIAARDSRGILFVVSTVDIPGYAFIIRASDHRLCAIQYLHLRLSEICFVRQAKVANVWVMNASDRHSNQSLKACVAISYHGCADIELCWTTIDQNTCESSAKSSILLPTAFEVTSVLYDRDLQVLICGSRAGALAVSANTSPSTATTETQLCNRRVHGQDTVTSIHKLGATSQSQQESFYLTTGRDGTYCIHRLDLMGEESPRLTTVHQISPLIGPCIEGAHIITRSDGAQNILLYGFHSKNFVVWNETCQTQVMSVDCGGSHRSWAFSSNGTAGQGGLFVWTKAGSFMSYKQKEMDHKIIQSGGHGREMKALTVHCLSRHKWLLATGSEDTDIRLFEYEKASSEPSKLKNLAVVKKHTTGLQDLQFSSDGKILISAAGMEELYAWSISPVPIIGYGTVFACALTYTNTQSDARIMSFDIRLHQQQRDSDGPSYLIAAAFSNGSFKTILLNPATITKKAYFTVLHQLDFGTICLTQAHFCPDIANISRPSHKVVMGATNGCLEVRDIPLSNGSSNDTTAPLTQISPDKVPSPHKIHQNSITALQVHHLPPTHHLLVTGGDDNALAITIVTESPQSPISHPDPLPPLPPTYTFKSLLIPNAHAAALTALHILAHPFNTTHPLQTFSVISAGNDQRLQLWKVTVDTTLLHSGSTSETAEEVQVQWRGEWYTDVADISGIDILGGSVDASEGGGNGDNVDGEESENSFVDVVIVGVGMEVIRLDLKGI